MLKLRARDNTHYTEYKAINYHIIHKNMYNMKIFIIYMF